MYYEVYLDSLFLVCFVIHLYLLLLLRKSLGRKGGTARLLLGAAMGGMGGVLPFLLGGNFVVKILFSVLVTTMLMLLLAFPVKSVKSFFQLWERLLFCSLLFAGGYLFVLNAVLFVRSITESLAGILGLGALIYLGLDFLSRRLRQKRNVCSVRLIHNEESVVVRAFVDTGNGLTEPISGKPVSVVKEEILKELWKEEPQGMRVIPYRAIGTEHGYLPGYLLPEIRVEMNGVENIYREVYIAAARDGLQGNGTGNIQMLLNPRMLQRE